MSSRFVSELVDRLVAGEPRALARALTLVENRTPESRELVSAIFPKTGGATVIGLTGPPGVGKSTLVDRIAESLAKQVESVAILAVDPSSPFTGGALLGDRARMDAASRDGSIFIRSMATRGHVGGLASATFDALALLEASGKRLILLETIGVGQDEVEVAAAVDLTVVVLAPGLGDDLQVSKAGLMEIADVFVVNKGDRPGADRLMDELSSLAESLPVASQAAPYRCVATTGEGVEALSARLMSASTQNNPDTHRRRFFEVWLREAVRMAAVERLHGKPWEDALDSLEKRAQAPHELAENLLATLQNPKDSTTS